MGIRAILPLTLFLLIAPPHGQAQDEFEVITADNAAQLQERLGVWGNGRLVNAVACRRWQLDCSAGSIGIWVYDATNLNTAPYFLEGHSQSAWLAFSPMD